MPTLHCNPMYFKLKDAESICLDVKSNENSWFILCVCYWSPNKCKTPDFINSCITAVEKMYDKWKEIIFIGNFNIDMLKIKTNQDVTNDLLMFADQFCLSNLINEPTRVTQSTKSLIDVILASHRTDSQEVVIWSCELVIMIWYTTLGNINYQSQDWNKLNLEPWKRLMRLHSYLILKISHGRAHMCLMMWMILVSVIKRSEPSSEFLSVSP